MVCFLVAALRILITVSELEKRQKISRSSIKELPEIETILCHYVMFFINHTSAIYL